MVASMLRRDAARLMKVALAGTMTSRLVEVVEAAFGTTEAEKRDDIEEEEGLEESVIPDTPSSTPISEVATPSTSTSEATPSTVPKRKASPTPSTKGKRGKSTAGICSLADAKRIYPSISDQENYLHAGVDDKFISHRKSSSIISDAGYLCNYSAAMKSEGHITPDCEFFPTVRGQLSTHIRQIHLGAAVTCYICDKKVWDARTWRNHMRNVHTSLSEKDFYVKEGLDVAEMQALVIKQEVEVTDL